MRDDPENLGTGLKDFLFALAHKAVMIATAILTRHVAVGARPLPQHVVHSGDTPETPSRQIRPGRALPDPPATISLLDLWRYAKLFILIVLRGVSHELHLPFCIHLPQLICRQIVKLDYFSTASCNGVPFWIVILTTSRKYRVPQRPVRLHPRL